MGFESEKTVEEVLKEIHARKYLMPAIQRELEWETDRIIRLFDSLLRGYPVGSFLFWEVDAAIAQGYVFYNFLTDYHEKDQPYAVREPVPAGSGTTAVLDGQQRLTALNIALYGSHSTKTRWARSANANAYPKRRLYLNLVDAPTEEELGLHYDLRFLTEAEASSKTDAEDKWFRIGDILKISNSGPAIMKELEERRIVGQSEAFQRLYDLYEAVRVLRPMNYYLVKERTPDEVLEIFIRVNSGGLPLTKSDLLLSMATNQWSTEPGAREEVRNLVTELNSRGFNFDKDFVLKTALTLVGADVRFQVSTITHANISKVENEWDAIRAALIRTVDFLKQSGFSRESLTAANAAIPIAYYFHKREVSDSYLSSSTTAGERAEIVLWLTRSLLKQGVWGSNPDTLLGRLRAAIDRELMKPGFPTVTLESEMASLGKALVFDDAEIEGLLDLSYNGRGTFATLAILYPGLDFSKAFHEDHIFPKSLFTRKKLEDAGIARDQLDRFLDAVNRLPNLQLLEGTQNQEKLAKLPEDWIRNNLTEARRASYLRENDLDGLKLTFSEFLEFSDARRERIRERLVKALGAATV